MSQQNTKNVTADVIVVLDESGSMGCMGNEPKEAMNQFIANQKKEMTDPNAQFSLYLFNSNTRKVHVNTPLKDVQEITDYTPGGMTALFDAVGQAITDKLNTDRNKNVVMVVITDGEENSSHEYKTREEVSKLVKKAEKDYQWKVMFLGANIDAFSEGQKLSVSQNHCLQYSQHTRGNLKKAVQTASDASNVYRHASYTRATSQPINLSQKK